MKAAKQVLLLLAGLWLSVSAQAVGPTATASFYVEDRETHKQSPAKRAWLGQLFAYRSAPCWSRTVSTPCN